MAHGIVDGCGDMTDSLVYMKPYVPDSIRESSMHVTFWPHPANSDLGNIVPSREDQIKVRSALKKMLENELPSAATILDERTVVIEDVHGRRVRLVCKLFGVLRGPIEGDHPYIWYVTDVFPAQSNKRKANDSIP